MKRQVKTKAINGENIKGKRLTRDVYEPINEDMSELVLINAETLCSACFQ